jgi:hypothetical protein
MHLKKRIVSQQAVQVRDGIAVWAATALWIGLCLFSPQQFLPHWSR